MKTYLKDNVSLNESFGKPTSGFSKANIKAPQGALFQRCTDDYGNEILRQVEANIVVFGGALTVLEALCNTTPVFLPETLNEKLGIAGEGTATGRNTLALFGAGTGGAGLANGSVIDPVINQDNILDIVPMRYCLGTVTGTDATKYFMKKDGGDDQTPNAYYLKEFDSGISIKGLRKNGIADGVDGEEITSDITNEDIGEGIEVFAEINISLNTKDVREYFEETGSVSSARYNTFGFYTGEKVGDEYQNVRLYSAITFNNRPLDLETNSEFVYRIYTVI